MTDFEIYKKQIDCIIKRNKKPSLLLHACCAPCSGSVLERLSDVFDVTVYFYNPNIVPESEYLKRLQEVERFSLIAGFQLIAEKYQHKDYTEAIKETYNLPEKSEKCYRCYSLRIKKTYQQAQELGFDFFTTTLSVSPHKISSWINEIGRQTESIDGPKFLVADFKKENGFLRSLKISEEMGFYRQKYCGCTPLSD